MTKRGVKIKISDTTDCRKLVELLENGDEVEVVEAAKQLDNLSLRQYVKPLIRLLEQGRTAHVRQFACYALAWMSLPRLNPVFIECLRNRKESEHVRGQAAEALGMLHGGGPSNSASNAYRAAEDLLIQSLSDESPVVRFWCCFALGCIGSKRAVGPLSRLKVSDKALCPGMWYVREEASDSLDMIQGREPPDRIRIHRRFKSRK